MVPIIEENNIAANFSDLIDKITIYYNKSNILDFLTPQSFTIVEHSVHELEDRFRSILRDFEQLQRQSNKSSANIDSVDETLSNLLTNGQEIQRDIHQRVEEIGATALNAQNAIAAFGVLKERTSEVEQMLANIKDISVRTGILAINASIEAAHAGNFGNGFRIIANEVRALATQTGDFTKQIEKKMNDLQATVSEINQSMSLFIELFSDFQSSFNNVLSNFDKNSTMLNNAGNSLRAITSSMRKQDKSIKDGFTSLQDIEIAIRNTETIINVIQASQSHLNTLLQSGKSNT